MGLGTAFYKLTKSLTGSDASGSHTSMNSKKIKNNYTTTAIDDYVLPINLIGYKPTTRNKLLNPTICHEFRPLFPNRVQLYIDWKLVYSLEQHGASLHSLYDNIRKASQPKKKIGYLLIVKDRKGNKFGAYCNEPWLPTEHRKYQGNDECFLWRLQEVQDNEIISAQSTPNDKDTGDTEQTIDKIRGQDDAKTHWRLFAYPHTGVNEFTMYCTSNFLSMGAGDGHYGLWLDDGLINGVSYRCDTYGNDPLSGEGVKFHIQALEVWQIGD